MKAQIKLAVIAGVLSLAASGLPFSCEGITSNGDIKGTAVDPGSGWTAIGDIKFDLSYILAVTYGGGKFVAVGETGKGAYSTDSVNWTAISDMKFGTTTIRAIAYGGGKFVAVGDDNKGAYSTDSVNWTDAYLNFTSSSDDAYTVAYGNGKFVARGIFSWMSYSSNGVTWTSMKNSDLDYFNCRGITYGGGKFVAVGDDGKGAYSTDGVTWTAIDFFLEALSMLP